MDQEETEVVFIIADLCGYSALTEAHGSLGAAKTATRYVEITHAVLLPGTRFVERVGDEVLIAADEAPPAVRTAIALRDAVEREPLFPSVRTGVHAGRVVEHHGSFFGSALNVTARVAAHARSSQIFCTERVRALAPALDEIAYKSIGAVAFKNILDPVSLFEVVSGHERVENAAVDPVCRMQVQPETAPARLPYSGRMYYFCSFDCAKIFAEQPERYRLGN